MSERPDAVRRMLEPRSVAVVGASARPGSFGERLTVEVLRSPLAPRVHLVHPRHAEVLGRRCLPTLADVPEPVDLVLLGVPDHALVEQLSLSAERGDRAAVVYGSARGLASEVASVAAGAGMALCGGGCMGFVNVTRGMRAIGYLERESLPAGPIALVTHSGSVFSALLRTRRRLEYTLAVSSGQELVTTTADYLGYALDLPGTEVVGLFVETMRDVAGLRRELERAARQDVAVVALAAGSSPVGRAMVGAHSGAVAGESAGWEALFGAYGVHPARDLDELVNTLELLAVGRRPRRRTHTVRRHGIATVHDSGGERALAADIAHTLRLPFAEIDAGTSARLAAALDEGMVAANPLDLWGTGAGTEALVSECLQALAADDAVDVTALAVDLVEEYDGDDSYPRAAVRAHQATEAPLVVLNSVSSAVDQRWADALRAEGIPVLEGLESGLRALRHLLDASSTPWLPEPHAVDAARRDRWASRLAACGRSGENLSGPDAFELLADYGLDVALPMEAGSEASVLRAAGRLGYPVALKTAARGVDHRVDVAGVVTGLTDHRALAAAYAEMAARLGPEVVVQPMVEPATELALGVTRDPHLGPLVLLAAGGSLVELVAERVVALPPLTAQRAEELLGRVPLLEQLLSGVRGRVPADRSAVARAWAGISELACELGDHLDAVDVNPLICDGKGAVAVDVLVIPSR